MGVSPPPLRLPPYTILPKKVIQHYRTAQGLPGGTGTVPSFKASMLIFCTLIKGILPSRKNYFSNAISTR
jgi:hypothetical protein